MDIENMNYHRDKDYLANEKLFRNIFQKRFNLLKVHLGGVSGRTHREKLRVLDIGCSNGVFLDLFKESGFETWGVEPSGIADRAKRKGHRVLNTFFEQARLPENYFDLVVVNHTLEHMDNPKQVLNKIHTVLKDGGIVFIDVPNFGSLSSKILGKKWPYLLPLEHKHQFTKESLTKLLKDSRFKVLHWESRSGIFEYANPLKELGRKRFLLDLFTFPYSLSATLLRMGDSMSFVAKKK